MEEFTAEQFIAFLDRIEKLKSVPRHCVTSDGVQETVAGHCWRTALMAYLMKEELGPINVDRVIRMCLLHDIGEAVTGDIPTFEKKEADDKKEREAVRDLLSGLPAGLYAETTALFEEMEAQETKEARVYKALDKLEAVIQHNESDIQTWLPLEYELQQTYAEKNVQGFAFLEKLQKQAVKRTKEKIAQKEIADGQNAPEPDARAQKEAAKQQARQEKERKREEKKAARALARQERIRELNCLFVTAGCVLLLALVVLAIGQAGLKGFLLMWIPVAVLAASVALLLLGVIRQCLHKRSGIIFVAAILGILLCSAFFLFLLRFVPMGTGMA